MNITFAPFTIDDYEAVLRLWKRCEGIGLSGADSREGTQAYLERNPGLSLVARREDAVVGSILCGHDGRRGYIHHLAVSPEFRRQGIGRRLVTTCLAALQARGIQKCHLFIFNDNFGGIEFWQCIGWSYRRDISVISKTLESDPSR